MLDQVKRVLHDREHASRLLSEKLDSYKNSNAVIVALPPGGVPVGKHLAMSLHLPLEFMLCKRIKHPAHNDQFIGCVTADSVVLQEGTSSLPQHYIYHQIHQLQHQIQSENKNFHRIAPHQNLTGKTVIVVDTFVNETEALSACLISLKKQSPLKIVVATLLATSRASFLMTDEEMEFHYIHMIMHKNLQEAVELYKQSLGDVRTTAKTLADWYSIPS